MTDKHLISIYPFRFQYKQLSFSNIANLKWDIWTLHNLGEFRKLTISTSSGYQTNISDFEFINYDSLEQWLIDNTDLKLDLDRKRNVELQQAKWNRWINIMVLVALAFYFFILSTGPMRHDIRLGIQGTIVLVTWRLVVRLVQYQQRINRLKPRK